MEIFINYKNQDCIMSAEQYEHIHQRHPEATNELISKCLKDPIEVRRSSSSIISYLYYTFKNSKLLFCVVLKECSDGNFISTAYTTNKMKNGKVIYMKEN